eukprot:3478696-Lingulodinium_polyedra.AAC.2
MSTDDDDDCRRRCCHHGDSDENVLYGRKGMECVDSWTSLTNWSELRGVESGMQLYWCVTGGRKR